MPDDTTPRSGDYGPQSWCGDDPARESYTCSPEPSAAGIRQKVLAELVGFAPLARSASGKFRAAILDDYVRIIRDALDVCPDEIIDRLTKR